MRNPILSALLIASAFQTALGAVEGQWTYIVEDGGATITGSTATGAVTIPSELNGIPVVRIGTVWPPEPWLYGPYGPWPTSIFGSEVLTPNTSVTSITIPNSVTSIGFGVFANCTGLTSINIPNSVLTIAGSTFFGCSGLSSITIPNSVTSIGDYAFRGCSSLATAAIGNSVTSIGTGVFANCTGLTSINIPNSVTSIGDNAFEACYGLTSILIPNSVTRIGWYAFGECYLLTGALTIPNSVTSIGGGAFSTCFNLTTLTIGSGVTSIGNQAFQGCSRLTTLTIPNSVTSIGDYAFANCTGLTGTLTIPNSVTSIGDNAFSYCTGLTGVIMPERFIGQGAQIGIRGQVATDYIINALANNEAFVTAVANKIKATGGTYGIATQSGLSSAIEPLATKAQITTAINEGKASGIASVTASPNTWSLFTTSQIQNMAVGDLVLTKNVGGTFMLNYDIEQSTDLQTWTPYQALSLPLTGLPTDKAFVRIKAKQ